MGHVKEGTLFGFWVCGCMRNVINLIYEEECLNWFTYLVCSCITGSTKTRLAEGVQCHDYEWKGCVCDVNRSTCTFSWLPIQVLHKQLSCYAELSKSVTTRTNVPSWQREQAIVQIPKFEDETNTPSCVFHTSRPVSNSFNFIFIRFHRTLASWVGLPPRKVSLVLRFKLKILSVHRVPHLWVAFLYNSW